MFSFFHFCYSRNIFIIIITIIISRIIIKWCICFAISFTFYATTVKYNDYYYTNYNAKNNEAYTISSGVLPDDYISKRSEYADKIIEVSNNIIIYDLIKKLD